MFKKLLKMHLVVLFPLLCAICCSYKFILGKTPKISIYSPPKNIVVNYVGIGFCFANISAFSCMLLNNFVYAF